MRKNARETKREQAAWVGPMLELVKGGAIAVGSCVVILLITAALMYAGLLGRGTEENCVVAACLLGALIGGIYAVSRCGRAALPVGVGTGAVEWMILLSVGALFFGGVSGAGGLWSTAGGCLCGGLLAGVLSAVRGKGNGRKR